MNTVMSQSIREHQDFAFLHEPAFVPDKGKHVDLKRYVDQIWEPDSERMPLSHADKSSYDGMIVSEKEYWSKYYEMSDVSLEWNNGRLEEKPMPDRESFELYSWLWRLLMEYFDTFDEGMLIGLETGFKLNFDNHSSIRKPDLAFIHNNNPNQMAPFERSYHGCFDICFEFLSDSDKAAVERDTVVKKHEYEKFGVKEYYILDRIGDETAFYYLDSKGMYQTLKPNKDGVIHSTILSQFKFREEDLYNRPKIMHLINDSVYQNFVMVAYQKERKARKLSEKKTEKAKIEAEKAKIEAEKAKFEAEKAKFEAEKAKFEAVSANKKAKTAESSAQKEKSRANQAESKIKDLEQELAKLRRQFTHET
jgi:Uma2 family endonuclease